ncbi:hypothetical protein, partial [Arthrobacter sp. HLT1-20]
MGITKQPGSKRASIPSGPSFLDQDPGLGPGASDGGCGDGGCGDAELARLMASDPFAEDPH